MATRKASKKNGKVVKNGKVKKASCAPLDLVSAIIEGVRKDGGDEYAQVLGSDSNLLKIRGVISSQCPGVDVAIGRGGWPLGRISIIHGGEGCLEENTFVPYEIRREDGTLVNDKGGTIKHLWERFHGAGTRGKGSVGCGIKGDPDAIPVFYAKSVTDDGSVVRNRIHDVVDSGVKQVFRLSSGSMSIVATGDHKFFDGEKYVPLKSLSVGSTVYVHNGTRRTGCSTEKKKRKIVMVKHHPVAPVKVVRDLVRGYANNYHRITWAKIVVEAEMNGLLPEQYVDCLNNGELAGLNFLGEELQIHHVNRDCSDDSLGNLQVMTAEEHSRLHAMGNLNLFFAAVPVKVTSIEKLGKAHTYDVKMYPPLHNFVADRFVVHNSGKTTLALHGCAECQRIGGVAVYIDKEYKLDPDYAAEVGVDLDKLVVMHPETLEDTIVAFKSIVRVIKANREATGERKPVIVVLDSINGCQAKETIEGDEGGRTYPNEARLWSKNLPEIAKICSAEDIALVLISQIRVKMNVMYGDPNEIAGGKAPKFHASVIAFVRYIGSIKEGTDKKRVGNNVEVEFKKNQIAPPFRKARLVMRYGEGVDYYSSLFEVALEQKWIRKKGTSYTYKGESLGQGKPGAIKTIRTDKPTRVALKKKLRGLWNVEARREEAKVQSSGESKGSKDNRGSKGKAAKGERRPISLDD